MQMPEEWGDRLSRSMRINPLSSVLREEETTKALKALQCKSSGQAGVNSIQCLQGKVLPCVLGGHCQQLCHCLFNPSCCWLTFFPALPRVPLAFIPHVSEKKQLDTQEGIEGDALCQQDSQAQHSHGQHVHSLPFRISC